MRLPVKESLLEVVGDDRFAFAEVEAEGAFVVAPRWWVGQVDPADLGPFSSACWHIN